MTSYKVVTPVPGFRRDRVTGVQVFYKTVNKLDSGACPGPDPGFAGMTDKGLLALDHCFSVVN
jgi:hypothetical protein